MNLKEIGSLLISLFILSTLLIGYKYYVARGKIFIVSRLIILKYSIRLLLLVFLLLLSFYTLKLNKSKGVSNQNVETTLYVISKNSSSLAWRKLISEFIEMPKNGYYGLIIFNNGQNRFEQIIPTTNYESFTTLIEQGHSSPIVNNKNIFSGNLRFKPAEDQYLTYQMKGSEWVLLSKKLKYSLFFTSKNTFTNWIESSYILVYLVISILLLLFIDIVFTTKAIKI